MVCWSSLTELNCRPSPYHGDALPTELRERIESLIRLSSMPFPAQLENLNFSLRRTTRRAEPYFVWIDRILSESPEGPSELDLHDRLTVIASADAARRLRPYRELFAALHVSPGTTIEVRTEYGDQVTAQRGAGGASALYDTKSRSSREADDPSLGLVGHINSQQAMTAQLGLLHATSSRLRERVNSDADLISLARNPLDQLYALASKITADEAALSETRTRRSDLSEVIRDREIREQSISEQLETSSEGNRKIHFLTLALFAVVALGLAASILVSTTIGAAICVVALIAAAIGFVMSKKFKGEDDFADQALDIQLGRVDELFDTHDLTRNRRAAEDSLAESVAQWRAVAGNIKPATLLKDRTRIEELASHLRLIDNEDVAPADTAILVGFASLLAELNRRFPAERVPLLIDDLFPEVAPQYHGVFLELILRASHRRQVVQETGDLSVAKWAAVEAVGGNALLISDFDIDVEPIINQAVAAQPR